MPHIIVEYCETLNTLDVPKLLSDLHDHLAERESVSLQSIKTRAVPIKYVLVGDAPMHNQMVHITLKLLPGRNDDLKKQMAQGFFDITHKALHHDKRISISVEVTELHAASYTK